MKYAAPIEYDAARQLTSVRGITAHLLPYAIELFGSNAPVWNKVLLQSKYRRKAMGAQPTRRDGALRLLLKSVPIWAVP